MPTLLLNRQLCLIQSETPARVICEPRRGISDAWCARIRVAFDAPHGLWEREYLRGAESECDGRPVKVYSDLASGYYEAHSTRTAKKSQSVYFRVTPKGRIVVLGTAGDEDLVIARLNHMTQDELHAARAAANPPDDLPVLRGSIKQVAWAERIRDALLDRMGEDAEASARLEQIDDATWFIAHRHDSRSALFAALPPRAPSRPQDPMIRSRGRTGHT